MMIPGLFRSRAFRCGVLVAAMAGASALAAPADTRIITAAKNGDTAAARRLLRQGVSAKAVDADGTTALHWAVRANDLDLTRALLSAGAPASPADRYGITPLALAAVNGSAPAIELLLKAGANPNAASATGETVLMTAARTGVAEAVRLLLARGARTDGRETQYGETALMWAAGQDHSEVIRLLAKAGADLNARSTVIDLPPVKVDLATMVTTALPRGGMTALMFAAREGRVDAARTLADVGADLNVTDPEGVTAIVLAIINSHFDVAAALAEKGADPNVGDKAGMAALYAAVDMVHPDVLLNRPKPTPTGPPTPAGLVDLLLARGADPNQRLKTPLLMRQHSTGDASLGEGATPLMRAAKVPDVPLMKTLLDHKADPSAALRNQTTTMMIVMGGRGARTLTPETPAFQAIQLLLDRGANVNGVNANGETLLHQSVSRGDAFVRLLASRGADLTAKDRSGRTPLDVAMGVAPAAPAGRAGRGGRGAGPGPAAQPVSESTVALLRELMAGTATAAP
jgi:ankyrin repeat protein